MTNLDDHLDESPKEPRSGMYESILSLGYREMTEVYEFLDDIRTTCHQAQDPGEEIHDLIHAMRERYEILGHGVWIVPAQAVPGSVAHERMLKDRNPRYHIAVFIRRQEEWNFT